MASTTFSGPVTSTNGFVGASTVTSYTVAGLPSAATAGAGSILYASDGRKNGELAAAGTGVLVFSDGTDWIAVDTGQTVAA